MATPSNIERFNELAARILADLYLSFPVPKTLGADCYGPDPSANCQGKPDDDTAFFAATMRWLVESGYLRITDALKSGSQSLLAETIKAVLAAGASRWFGE